jgi:transposase
MIGRRKKLQPTLFIPGTIEQFIPDDHILKRVDRVLDLSWLRDEVADSYCEDNGRPSIDPEAAVRLMLAGFFHGIVHDRKLMREAQVNIAIRWFAGYGLEDKLPDHSSLTNIRKRWGAECFNTIFLRTVRMCNEAGLVSGDTVHFDATLIRADVSWESLTLAHAGATLEENCAADEAAGREEKDKTEKKSRPHSKPKKRSTTDPDATMTTSNKEHRMEPAYKQHTAVDDKAGVIVGIEVTTGEASEGLKLIEIIEHVESATGVHIARATADGSYAYSKNYRALEERETDPIIPPQKTGHIRGAMPASRFKYDAKHETVQCPGGKRLSRRSRVKNGWIYRGAPSDCGACPMRKACVPDSARARTIFIADGHTALLRARRRHVRGDPDAVSWYKRHRWRVEGVHGEAKTQHGLRRAVRRGTDNVAIQAYLTAAAMNLKRLAAFFSPSNRIYGLVIGFFSAFLSPVCVTPIFSENSVKQELICVSSR